MVIEKDNICTFEPHMNLPSQCKLFNQLIFNNFLEIIATQCSKIIVPVENSLICLWNAMMSEE